MGSGRNGSFDKTPDWQQWGILAVHPNESPDSISNATISIRSLYGRFIHQWFRLWGCETWTILLEPIEGHGYWDGKTPFGLLSKQTDYSGPIAILTRATIRLNKLSSFWKNVDAVADKMDNSEGFITSIGIGEVPFIKQATFSIWQSREAMKQFAYSMKEHADVIRKTRKEDWYSEDMFVRFKPLKTIGSIRGLDPLAGKL